MPLRCPSCNKFRAAEEFEAESAELENVGVDDGDVYGELTATIIVTCRECGDEIGRLEVSGVDVKLGPTKDIEPSA